MSHQQGLAPLNPNAVSGNSMMYQYNNNNQGYYNNNNNSTSMNSSAMNISPIMACSGSTPNQQQQDVPNNNNNVNDASVDSIATTKTASSIVSAGGTHHYNANANANRQVRRRKYTHNPYAASSSAASSRASSIASADNSTPSTPMSGSFSGNMMNGNNVNAVSTGNNNNNAVAPVNNNNSAPTSALTLDTLSMMNNGHVAAVAAAGGYQQQQQSQQDMMAMMNNTNNMMAMMNNMNMNMNNQNNTNLSNNFGLRGNNNNNNNNRRQNNNGNNNTSYQHNQHNNMNMMNNNNTNSVSDMMMSLPNSANSLKAASEQFDSMRGSIVSNACNQRGRHVVVAMIRLQQPEYNDVLFDELSQGWGQLISDMNGCHVARTFVETVPSETIKKLSDALSREVVLHMCSASQYSRRVLQTMFETHSSAPHLQNIVDHVASGAVALATTQQGCISVMRVLEFSKPEQREKLMNQLTPHLAALAADPYGNYVLQTITQALGSNEQVCVTLEKAFEGSWVALSCNKFASNVMEKIIKISAETPSSTVRKTIIDELVCNNSHLSIIIVDNFGNFVLQAIIDSCNNVGEFKKIGDRVKPLLATSPYGHKIEGKLKNKRFNNSRSSSQDSGY